MDQSQRSPLPSYRLAMIGAYAGYLAAFTYARMNWREATEI